MIETLLKLPFSAAINLLQLAFNRSRLRIECGSNLHPNEDGVGNYVAFWIKIINPTKSSIYLERIEAKDSRNDVFFPMIMGDNTEKEIPPQRNIVVLIPCGHVVNTSPKIISVVDATEKYHNLKGKKLNKAVIELKKEVARLKLLGIEVNPKTRLSEYTHS